MLPDQKLDALVIRQAALERDLAAALPAETYVKLSREFAELAPVVEAVRSYRAAKRELDDLTSLIADPTTDPEMRSIAEAERPQVESRRVELERDVLNEMLSGFIPGRAAWWIVSPLTGRADCPGRLAHPG